jgi:hypothetical protein
VPASQQAAHFMFWKKGGHGPDFTGIPGISRLHQISIA